MSSIFRTSIMHTVTLASALALMCVLIPALVDAAPEVAKQTSAKAEGTSAPAPENQWPRFRGPNGTGISDLKGVPTQWTMDDYEWIVDLPGLGHSSPAVWGERLFLTSGTAAGERILLCLNALTGKEIWSHEMRMDSNHLHQKNSYGSGTPAIDAEFVYVPYADESHYVIQAFTHDGEPVWSKDLGQFTSQHGQGVSPIVYENLVIVPNDQQGPSSIAALDRKTGEVVWNADRAVRRTSYSTPMILNLDGQKPQLICISGATGVTSLDPKTGKQNWISGELPMRTVASPVYGEGVVIASCGSGGTGKYMVAVEPTGSGDVSSSHVRFNRQRELPYVPTPVFDNGYLFLWNDGGVVCCIDPKAEQKDGSSENVWIKRVSGKYSGSPVVIDGKIYCISEEGQVAVIDASPEYHFYGFSPLGDASYGTPAVANGRVYFRTFTKLACLKAKTASEGK